VTRSAARDSALEQAAELVSEANRLLAAADEATEKAACLVTVANAAR
jgi:hypothetical protein